MQWIIGSKFKGIKLIPLGAHYVYYALKSENYQFKIGFFINVSPQSRVFVRKWNEQIEDFLKVPDEEETQYTQAIYNFDFDQYLGAYPADRLQAWQEISQYIDQSVLDKLNPIEKTMYL